MLQRLFAKEKSKARPRLFVRNLRSPFFSPELPFCQAERLDEEIVEMRRQEEEEFLTGGRVGGGGVLWDPFFPLL